MHIYTHITHVVNTYKHNYMKIPHKFGHIRVNFLQSIRLQVTYVTDGILWSRQYISHHILPCHNYIFMSLHLLCDGVFILGGHKEVLEDITFFEVYLYPTFITNVIISAIAIGLVVFIVCFNFKPVESPTGIIASLKDPPINFSFFCSSFCSEHTVLTQCV